MHDIIIDSLLTIDSILCGSLENKNQELRDNFLKYARQFLSPITADLNGWNSKINDSNQIITLRSQLINAMIIFQDNDIIENGNKRDWYYFKTFILTSNVCIFCLVSLLFVEFCLLLE